MANLSVAEIFEVIRIAKVPTDKTPQPEDGKPKVATQKLYGFFYREKGLDSIYISTGKTRKAEEDYRNGEYFTGPDASKVALSEVAEFEVLDFSAGQVQTERDEREAKKKPKGTDAIPF